MLGILYSVYGYFCRSLGVVIILYIVGDFK